MSTSGKTLNEYLSNVKPKKDGTGSITAIIGNEASDLDSMACSVMYGYLRQQDSLVTYLPIINIPRRDFVLRTEAVYLFEQAGIELTNLTFLDEVDLNQFKSNPEFRLALMDHNRLTGPWQGFDDSVDTVIDHHKDENQYTRISTRLIEPVGSCMTLITEEIFNAKPALVTPDLAKLMVGTILLDTVNLDPKAERVTPKDESCCQKLFEVCPLGQQELFDKVQFEKFNVASLCTADLLRKDYKGWKLGTVQCGISSVLLPITDWCAKDANLEAEFKTYAKNLNLDVLLSMIAYTDPDFKRQLVVYSPNPETFQATVKFLESADLKLSRVEPSNQKTLNPDHVAFYNQGHLGISRKKLQPILSEHWSK